jgi:glycosyltransferase involved in cell wall biosynthesis
MANRRPQLSSASTAELRPIAVGLVSPLPPQVGGVSSVAEWLLSHEYSLGVRYALFDLWRPVDDEMGGRIRLSSLPRQLRLLGAFLAWLPSSPPMAHIMVSCSRVGLFRDLAYVGLLRLRGRRVIVHVHGSQLDLVERSRIRALELRLIGRLAATCVVPTPWAARMVGRLGIRATSISNPIRISPGAAPTDRGNSSRLHLLFVGSLGRRKGVPELIAAVAKARAAGSDVTLLLVGKEERRGERRMIEEEIRKTGQEHVVTFAGLKSAGEMRELYAAADAVCLPSHREVLPMTLLEAMAFALPVIATDVGGIPDLVEDGATGILVSPRSVEELTSAISRLAHDPELRRALGQAAQARVASFASATTIVRQWRALYADVNAKPLPPLHRSRERAS